MAGTVDFPVRTWGSPIGVPRLGFPAGGLDWGSPPLWPTPATGEGEGGGGMPDWLRRSSRDDRGLSPLPNPPPFAELLTGEGNLETRQRD
jgi:hypothetical protein